MHLTFVFDDIILGHQPLGASYISAVLKEAGHKVTAINLDDEIDYVDRIRELQPDGLMYSVSTSQAPRYFEANRRIKQEYKKDVFSIFGGPHPQFFPKMVEEEGVDASCIGEGEYPTLEVVTALEEGRDHTHVDTMHFNVNGNIIRNAARPFIGKVGLNDVPFPDRELIRGQAVWNHRTGYIMAGRGCPYDCTFCFNHKSRDIQEGRWTRQRSVDNVLDELKWLKDKYKIIYVAFQDDTFILNRRWLRSFLPRYRDEIGLPFICNVRCDLTDEEEAELLADAGCVRVATGIENGDDELRRTILAKNISTEQIIKACNLYYQHGIRVIGQNMIGVPGETVESVLSTIDLNIKCKTHINTFSFFAPFPGTKLGEICEQDYGFTGDLKELPREYQEGLAPSITLDNREIIERIGHCAHLFVSYPKLFDYTKMMLKVIPTYSLKVKFLDWLFYMKRELMKKGNLGLPSVWHPPKFIVEAIHAAQPDIPIQEISRAESREGEARSRAA